MAAHYFLNSNQTIAGPNLEPAELFSCSTFIKNSLYEVIPIHQKTSKSNLCAMGNHKRRGSLSRRKTGPEHPVPAGDTAELRMKVHGCEEYAEFPQSTSFKYSGTTIHLDRGWKAEVEQRIEKVVLCDKKVSARLKMLLYNVAWPFTKHLEDD